MRRDLLWAMRWLWKNPLFSLIVIATLALGTGATTAVFSMVDAVLLRPLPYPTPGQLAVVYERTPGQTFDQFPAADYLRWSTRADLFRLTAAYRTDVPTLTGIETPDQVLAVRTTASLFSLLGVHAQLGRTLMEPDDRPGSPETAVLSDKLWQRLFHADPKIVGKSFRAGAETVTIVGVMPPEFEFPYPTFEMWLPLRLTVASKETVNGIARLQEGVAIQQVEGALRNVAEQLQQEDQAHRTGLRIAAAPWSEDAGGKARLSLLFIFSAVGFLLLIACANVASLMLSRSVQRQKEIGIRASLGAGFWRIVRQLLAESIVLTAAGTGAGILVGDLLLRYLSKRITALPIVIPHLQHASITGRVFLFNALLCLVVASVFSLVPLFIALRVDLQGVLRSGRTDAAPRGATRFFFALIASEAALGFLLVAGSGLMIRSLIRLQSADRGFRPDHVLTMRVPIGSFMQQLPKGPLETKPQQMAYFHELLDRLRATPGVRAAALVNNLPLSGFNSTLSFRLSAGTPAQDVRTRSISAGYFAVMGIPILAGRAFLDSDRGGTAGVAIVNESLVRRFFPDRSPIGQIILHNDDAHTIVGVVKDTSQMKYEGPAAPELYLPYEQNLFAAFLVTFVVRADGDPLTLAGSLRQQVWALNRDQPIVKVETFHDVIADAIWRPRFSAWVLSVITVLALVLMSAGVYGVIAYTSSLRAHEMGIRMALGAGPRGIAASVLRGALAAVCTGLAVSVVAALALGRLLGSLLFEVSAADPGTYTGAVLLLVGIGVLASAAPAWKAATADPLKVLRSD